MIMKSKGLTTTLAAVLMATAGLSMAPRLAAQTLADQLEVVRGALTADRKVVIAECMGLTDQESGSFWPIYRAYRAEMDKIGDGRVGLVLEYAEIHANLSEDRAKALLKRYNALEAKAVTIRAKYLTKLGRVLPATKVLRFAQLENRLDLALRLQVAGAVPLASSVAGSDLKR